MIQLRVSQSWSGTNKGDKMSRAKSIFEEIENILVLSPNNNQVVEKILSTAGDPPHKHTVILDYNGNGTSSCATEVDDKHCHEIRDYEVLPAGQFVHTHVFEGELFGEGVWHDEVKDTKEKVSVEKASPTVRRVYNKKTGQYMGSYDMKKKEQANRYKSMYKSAK